MERTETKFNCDMETGLLINSDEIKAEDLIPMFEHGLICKVVNANTTKYFINLEKLNPKKCNRINSLMFYGARYCSYNSHCKYFTNGEPPNENCYGCLYFEPATKKQLNKHEKIKEYINKFIPYCPNIDDIKEEKDSGWVDYRKYLKSQYWQEFRLKAMEHYDNKCSWCGVDGDKSNLQVHHLHYKNLGNEGLEDVSLLCPSCHKKAHGKY